MNKALLLTILAVALWPPEGRATDYYVRQTVGSDTNDGLSPQTAWEHFSKLSGTMQAGDTAYVGPGLYRETVGLRNSGTADKRITFIADTTGEYTGDPPGVVLVTGADPAKDDLFVPHSAPGVYKSSGVIDPVHGVVEMDGLQYRYKRARDTKQHLIEKLSELDVVVKLPSCFFYDKEEKILYIHTSNGKPPDTHEIELIHRGNGISITGKHYITVVGFTFRHMGDAGINFFKESGNGIAINNTSWGSRQGIRIYNATDVFLYKNVLFRNENCGAYFALRSTNGRAIGNIAYENIKGLRWSSESVNALVVDNALFDNHERGVAIENADHALLMGNRMVNNKESQLMVMRSEYISERNCFENGNPEQLTADFIFTERYKTLAEYQKEKRHDLLSREGGCGKLPKKVDVRKLHRATKAYARRARAQLGERRKSTRMATTSTDESVELAARR
jgi:hypothetical protein